MLKHAVPALALLALPLAARAEDTHPPIIRQQLGLSGTPRCTLCHSSPNGGKGTVVMPFARSMQTRGLTSVASTVAPALQKLEADGVDSDGDGTADIAELRAGTSPNGAGALELETASEAAGCGAAPFGPAPLALLGLAGLALRSRRRRA